MLHLPTRKLDVVLDPGQFHFGQADLRIGTLLGSCVAITMWHPIRKIGGMCHYLLPSRNRDVDSSEPLDGRYGDEAVEMFMQEIQRANTFPEDYEAKIFGGGNQFGHSSWSRSIDVPSRNIAAGMDLLQSCGLDVRARHVGGSGPRNVILDLASGHVWVRHRRTPTDEATR